MTDNVCGHVNKHSPKPYLECSLEEGHEGNHSAKHKVKATQLSGLLDDEGMNKLENKVEDGVSYYIGEVEAHWSDIAGTAPEDIKPRSPGIEIIDSVKQKEWETDKTISELQEELAKMEKRFAALEKK